MFYAEVGNDADDFLLPHLSPRVAYDWWKLLRATFLFRNPEVADSKLRKEQNSRACSIQFSPICLRPSGAVLRVAISFASRPPAMSTDSTASVSSSTSSLWDRITTWASENKAVVYTIAGTAVVITGAGAIYYFSDSRRDTSTTPPEKKKSKKERRNEKKKAEEESKSGITLKDEEAGMHLSDTFLAPPTHALTAVPTPKAPTVEPEEELPQIDETTIDSYAQEVRMLNASIFFSESELTSSRNEKHLQPS